MASPQSRLAQEGGQEEEEQPRRRSTLLTVCPFILGNELCERLAFYGCATCPGQGHCSSWPAVVLSLPAAASLGAGDTTQGREAGCGGGRSRPAEAPCAPMCCSRAGCPPTWSYILLG